VPPALWLRAISIYKKNYTNNFRHNKIISKNESWTLIGGLILRRRSVISATGSRRSTLVSGDVDGVRRQCALACDVHRRLLARSLSTTTQTALGRRQQIRQRHKTRQERTTVYQNGGFCSCPDCITTWLAVREMQWLGNGRSVSDSQAWQPSQPCSF